MIPQPVTTVSPILPVARRYQRLGWPVAPTYGADAGSSTGCSCRDADCSSPAKHPVTAHGIKDASIEERLARIWFERWPDRGIALATGRSSGVWVLDLDGPEGMDSLHCLIAEHGELPRTVASRTGGGGYHLLWRMPEDRDVRNSASQVAPAIDVRGSGGYIVLPPSGHVSGRRYEWVDGRSPWDLDPVPAPRWLVDLAAPPRPEPLPINVSDAARPRSYVRAAIEQECAELARTPEGGRNSRLNVAAYSLARFVTSGEADGHAVARALAYAAAQAGLGEREIHRTLQSAFSARGVS